MYFLVSCGVLALLVWLRVLTVHDAWLMGIPAFALFYLGAVFVRYIGYRRSYGPTADLLQRFRENIRQFEAKRRSQKEKIEIGSEIVSAIARLFGHPWLGTGIEVAGSLLSDKLSGSEPLEVKQLRLKAQILEAAVEKGQSQLSGFTFMMLVVTIGTWLALYHKIIDVAPKPEMTRAEKYLHDGDNEISKGDLEDAMDSYSKSFAEALVNDETEVARLARRRMLSVAAMKGDRDEVRREVDLAISDICLDPGAIRTIESGRLPDSIAHGILDAAFPVVLEETRASLETRRSLTERFMQSHNLLCRNELRAGRLEQARQCASDLLRTLDCLVDRAPVDHVIETVDCLGKTEPVEAHTCLLRIVQFPESESLGVDRLSRLRKRLLESENPRARTEAIEREFAALAPAIRLSFFVQPDFAPKMDPDERINRALTRSLRASVRAAARAALQKASRIVNSAMGSAGSRNLDRIERKIAALKTVQDILEREAGFSLVGTREGDKVLQRSREAAALLERRKASLQHRGNRRRPSIRHRMRNPAPTGFMVGTRAGMEAETRTGKRRTP